MMWYEADVIHIGGALVVKSRFGICVYLYSCALILCERQRLAVFVLQRTKSFRHQFSGDLEVQWRSHGGSVEVQWRFTGRHHGVFMEFAHSSEG